MPFIGSNALLEMTKKAFFQFSLPSTSQDYRLIHLERIQSKMADKSPDKREILSSSPPSLGAFAPSQSPLLPLLPPFAPSKSPLLPPMPPLRPPSSPPPLQGTNFPQKVTRILTF